jgi:hypothetical protein
VSVGHFAIEDNFILGPAVDEAAGLMECADAAIVWLAPSAGKLNHILFEQKGDQWGEMIVEAAVPLRDGRSIRMKALNPFALCKPGEAISMRKNLSKSMSSDRLDVILKRQNTNAFFKAIDDRDSLRVLKAKYGARRKPQDRSNDVAP